MRSLERSIDKYRKIKRLVKWDELNCVDGDFIINGIKVCNDFLIENNGYFVNQSLERKEYFELCYELLVNHITIPLIDIQKICLTRVVYSPESFTPYRRFVVFKKKDRYESNTR